MSEKTTIRGTVIERYQLDNAGFMPAPIALVRDDETGQLVEVSLFGVRGDWGQYVEIGWRIETTGRLVEGSQSDRMAVKSRGRVLILFVQLLAGLGWRGRWK